MKLRIKDWDSSFENDRSRRVDKCGFVCMPNSEGQGLRELKSHEDWLAVFGLFAFLVEQASKHPKPRTGWLTRGGRQDGIPWTAETIASWVRYPVSTVKDFIAILTSRNVGWIEDLDASSPSSHHAVTTNSLHKEGRKEGISKSHSPVSPEVVGEAEPETRATGGGPAVDEDAYTPAFNLAWKNFPQIGRDRSSRPESWKVWKQLKLESIAEKVIAGIETFSTCDQWTREGGKFIPGMHRWLKKKKWTEPPRAAADQLDPDTGFVPLTGEKAVSILPEDGA